MLANHYLIVQRWHPFLLTNETEVQKIAVWIRIPNLPIKLYNQRFLTRLGSGVGKMLKIDHLTSIHSRGKFARIYVEVNLAKQLIPTIKVMGQVLNLEYEGLHQICFTCGKYGHRLEGCPDRVTVHSPKKSVATELNPLHQDPNSGQSSMENTVEQEVVDPVANGDCLPPNELNASVDINSPSNEESDISGPKGSNPVKGIASVSVSLVVAHTSLSAEPPRVDVKSSTQSPRVDVKFSTILNGVPQPLVQVNTLADQTTVGSGSDGRLHYDGSGMQIDEEGSPASTHHIQSL
ncbi:unnamed protein product [Lupinus luteus]|uniref:CCHC-type domain-containing protein n=1 Tax=Lupinus luteus TaxID=3873 RepID=A0AAV1XFD3_LUPLU